MKPRIKSYVEEQKLDRVLWQYIDAFDKERGRPRLIMTKLWQLMQISETKNLNLDKDLDEILNKIKQTRWDESTRTKEVLVARRRGRSITVTVLNSSHRWRAFVAEWVSVKEMKALQGACMRTSMKGREQQYEELLSELG